MYCIAIEIYMIDYAVLNTEVVLELESSIQLHIGIVNR